MKEFTPPQKFKYKPFIPEALFIEIVTKCRNDYPHGAKENHRLLGTLGVIDEAMRWDILHGEVELYINEVGDIDYIDHRVTKQVMERMIEKEEPQC